MALGNFLTSFGKAVVRTAAAQQQRRRAGGNGGNGGGGGGGSECTPCAAEAYVRGLRPNPPKKTRSK